MKKISSGMEMFYIFTEVLSTLVYILIKVIELYTSDFYLTVCMSVFYLKVKGL